MGQDSFGVAWLGGNVQVNFICLRKKKNCGTCKTPTEAWVLRHIISREHSKQGFSVSLKFILCYS